MKTFLKTVIVAMICITTFMIFYLKYIEKIFDKVCHEEKEYYWTTWAGNYKFVGSDYEIAKKLAGDEPLAIYTREICK